MIFGKTYAEEQAARDKKVGWSNHFAWLPVKLEGGNFAWLQTVEVCRFYAFGYGYENMDLEIKYIIKSNG